MIRFAVSAECRWLYLVFENLESKSEILLVVKPKINVNSIIPKKTVKLNLKFLAIVLYAINVYNR